MSECEKLARSLRDLTDAAKGLTKAVNTLNNRLFQTNQLEAARQELEKAARTNWGGTSLEKETVKDAEQ